MTPDFKVVLNGLNDVVLCPEQCQHVPASVLTTLCKYNVPV